MQSSTNYVILFVLILTSICAVSLTGLRELTKTKSAQNAEIFNKRAILSSVDDFLGDKKSADLSDEEVIKIFSTSVKQVALDMDGNVVDKVKAEKIDLAQEKKKPEAERLLPLFVYTSPKNEQLYIASVRGSGLWDEIWGNIALKSDLSTIAGVAFDHKGETPGLGAEIKDNPAFGAQFKGKQIMDEGAYVSVKVRKGGAQDKNHEVDGISGATITSDGVTEMLQRGLGYYQSYFETVNN